MASERVVRETKSVCPTCLEVIDAQLVERDDTIWMQKSCKEHGECETIVWEADAEHYIDWIGEAAMAEEVGPDMQKRPMEKGCPHDCGPCESHCEQMVSVALMTSNVCNIDCPICFTKIDGQAVYMPSTEQMCEQIDKAAERLQGEYPLELCGGEPTVRNDLKEIIAHANSCGFHHIQVNTNGLRLAAEADYAKKLVEWGVSVIYLGFEGTDRETYVKKYGRDLYDTKIAAIESCVEAGLAVVLATVVLPDLNGDGLREIVEVAKRYSPTIRGINFQPISYFGTYEPGERVTIPRVIRSLSETEGIEESDFVPVNCQHPLCSFQAAYMIDGKGRLKSITPKRGLSSAKKVRDYTAKAWSKSPMKLLTIGGMAFMDAWNFDLERVRRCRIGVLSPERGVVPLCSQYLSSVDGAKIYEGIC